jgi:RHS repeat-associated protein
MKRNVSRIGPTAVWSLCFATLAACGPSRQPLADDGSRPPLDPLRIEKGRAGAGGAITAPVGTIASTLSVSETTGAAQIALRFEVPPGVRGLAPELGLAYSSSGGNGLVGVGWALSGLSEISRCGSQRRLHGAVLPVRFVESDALCLDGQPLVAVKGTSGKHDTRYRTERETWNDVASVGSIQSPSSSFVVRARGGLILSYGSVDNARVTATGDDAATAPLVYRWALRRVEDRLGNYLEIDYAFVDEAGARQEFRPQRIRYTGRQGAAPLRSVELGYERRPDLLAGYLAKGVGSRMSYRLASVDMHGPLGLVRRYALHYGDPSVSRRSLLRSVEECAADGGCKPATQIGWREPEPGVGSGGLGSYSFDSVLFPEPDQAEDRAIKQLFLDADGDGRTDILALTRPFIKGEPADYQPGDDLSPDWQDAPPPVYGNWQLWRGGFAHGQGDTYDVLDTGISGAFPATPAWTGAGPIGWPAAEVVVDGDTQKIMEFHQTEGAVLSLPVNFDNDGRTDVLSLMRHKKLRNQPSFIDLDAEPSGDRFQLLVAKNGGYEQRILDDGSNATIHKLLTPDLDGDGLSDVLFCRNSVDWDAYNAEVEALGGDWLAHNEVVKAYLALGRFDSRWYFAVNDPSLPNGWPLSQAKDTGVSCGSDATLLMLDVDGSGTGDVLVPEGETYHRLSLDLVSGAGTLVPTGLPLDFVQRARTNAQDLSIDRIVDANNDGLPDLLRYELVPAADRPDRSSWTAAEKAKMLLEQTCNRSPEPDPSEGLCANFTPAVEAAEVGAIRLWINTGGRFADGGVIAVLPGPSGFWRHFLPSTVLDWNGDGKLDLVLPAQAEAPGPTTLRVLLAPVSAPAVAGGAAAWEAVPTVRPFYLDEEARNSLATADIDGDGLGDLLVHSVNDEDGTPQHGRFRIYPHGGAAGDLVTSIVNGLGERATVAYAPLTDPAVYGAALPAEASQFFPPSYPVAPFVSSASVVIATSADAGLTTEATRVTSHRYFDARFDRFGGGFLGFTAHEVTERNVPMEVHTQTLRQFGDGLDHRLAGLTTYETQHTQLEAAADLYAPAGDLGEERRFHTQRSHRTYEVKVSDKGVSQVHLDHSTTEEFEVDAASCGNVFCAHAVLNDADPLRRTELTREVDDFGNVKLETTKVGASTTIAARSFDNLEGPWLLGLVRSERVTHSVPGDSVTKTQTWDYLADGRLHHNVIEPGDPAYQLTTTLAYDVFGNTSQTVTVDAEGEERKNHVTYDAEGVFPRLLVNGLLHIQRTEWNRGLGVRIEEVDANGVATRTKVDGFGRPIERQTFSAANVPLAPPELLRYQRIELSPLDVVTRVEVTANGDVPSRTDFDRLGRQRLSRTLTVTGAPVITTTEYDWMGRISRQSLPTPEGEEPEGYKQYAYDQLGRLIREQAADGSRSRKRYARTTTVTIDENDHFTRQVRNAEGQVIQAKDPFVCDENECKMGIVDSTCFDYGASGTMTKLRPCEADFNPAYDGPAPVVMVYDRFGRRTELHDEKTGLRTTSYDAYGQVTSTTDAAGAVSHFHHDVLGRTVSREDAQGVTRWIWDEAGLGLIARTVSPTGHVVEHSYDAFNRSRSVTRTIGGETFRYDHAYDPDTGRLDTVAYPSPSEKARFTVRYRYGALGHLVAVEDAANGAQLWRLDEADLTGRVARESLGNGTQTEYGFEPAQGRLASIRTQRDGELVQALAYRWQPNGNLDWRRDLRAGAEKQETFTYDARDRVISATVSAGGDVVARSFSYDPYGNLTHRSDVGAFSYSAQQLTFAGNTNYAYNPNGGVESRNGDDFTSYTYTPFEKLATATPFGGDEARFEYDADRERVLRTQGDEQTVYAGETYRRVRAGQAPAVHLYTVTFPSGTSLEVSRTFVSEAQFHGSHHYVHADSLGSTDVVTDDDGEVVRRMSYDVWGRRRAADWLGVVPSENLPGITLGYTGHESAEEPGGLVDMRGRMYDPLAGRFTSPDPLVQAPLDSRSHNRYSYVWNNPLANTDPTGFETCLGSCSFEPLKVTPSAGAQMADSLSRFAAIANAALASLASNLTPQIQAQMNAVQAPTSSMVFEYVSPAQASGSFEWKDGNLHLTYTTGTMVRPLPPPPEDPFWWKAGKFAFDFVPGRGVAAVRAGIAVYSGDYTTAALEGASMLIPGSGAVLHGADDAAGAVRKAAKRDRYSVTVAMQEDGSHSAAALNAGLHRTWYDMTRHTGWARPLVPPTEWIPRTVAVTFPVSSEQYWRLFSIGENWRQPMTWVSHHADDSISVTRYPNLPYKGWGDGHGTSFLNCAGSIRSWLWLGADISTPRNAAIPGNLFNHLMTLPGARYGWD